jgi:hypothetical protein
MQGRVIAVDAVMNWDNTISEVTGYYQDSIQEKDRSSRPLDLFWVQLEGLGSPHESHVEVKNALHFSNSTYVGVLRGCPVDRCSYMFTYW